jgi:hypothetical protein
MRLRNSNRVVDEVRQSDFHRCPRNPDGADEQVHPGLLHGDGFVPDKLITDELRSYAAAAHDLGIAKRHNAADGATTEPRTRINRPDDVIARCKGSRAWDPRKDFSQSCSSL